MLIHKRALNRATNHIMSVKIVANENSTLAQMITSSTDRQTDMWARKKTDRQTISWNNTTTSHISCGESGLCVWGVRCVEGSAFTPGCCPACHVMTQISSLYVNTAPYLLWVCVGVHARMFVHPGVWEFLCLYVYVTLIMQVSSTSWGVCVRVCVCRRPLAVLVNHILCYSRIVSLGPSQITQWAAGLRSLQTSLTWPVLPLLSHHPLLHPTRDAFWNL